MNFSRELSHIEKKLSTPLELRNFELFKYALQPDKAKAICKHLALRANGYTLMSVLSAALCAYSYSALLGNIVSGGTFLGALGLYLALVVTGGATVLGMYLRYVLLSEQKAIADVYVQSIGIRLQQAYQVEREEPKASYASVSEENEDSDLVSLNRR